MEKKTRGRPKKIVPSQPVKTNVAELMKSVDLIVTSMQESERRGYEAGFLDGQDEAETIAYDEGLVNGYLAGSKAAYKLQRQTKEDKEDEDFNFWTTFLSTIVIGSVLILLWWALSGQLPPWKS